MSGRLKRGLEGEHGSPSQCEYFRPEMTVTVGGHDYHGCDFGESPGMCPFNGDLDLCGERD